MNNLLPLLLLVLIFGAVFWVYRKKATAKIFLPPVIPQEGLGIPIVNAYQGTRLFNVHNGLWATLTLFEDHFEFLILLKKSFNFGDVKSVDVVFGWLSTGTSLVLSFNNGAWNYCAFMNKHNLHEVLIYFKTKGCLLTPKAEEFLSLQF